MNPVLNSQHSCFLISLDFELHWGVRDKRSIEDYREYLDGGRDTIPRLLRLFAEYGIHVTWATVGFLFFDTRKSLTAGFPARFPEYSDSNLSPYLQLTDSVGSDEVDDPYHYAPSLIRLITSFPHQEIGSHTFSHYYCLEEGQSPEAFKADLEAACQAAENVGLTVRSLVFPRNQFNPDHLAICREAGFTSVRGNECSWVYRAADNSTQTSPFRRAIRLADAYINLSGHNATSLDRISESFPYNIPSSRYFRPWSGTLKRLEPLKLRRITKAMEYAARHGLVYHLWWHPHNFGRNPQENLEELETVLKHYQKLQSRYGMESANMGEIADMLLKQSTTPETGEEA